jgi:chromosome segregation protein
MKLKTVQLNGFKSFARKSDLNFSAPVTAIVGPNGSGKSNIVEAFRFVLGEQSIKSMRGKSGSDLIFKGSKTISKLSRAQASISFDNKKRGFKFQRDTSGDLNLDFDEIIISREVFSDGVNKYKINEIEVRLKDLHELLASVNVGTSSHHIISQGQSDRVLNSSAKERRQMIEDALGLKVYQIKLKDSERRLEKTLQNIKEIESLRREISPHIRFLKKQVDKINKTQEQRIELGVLYKDYLVKEKTYVHSQTEKLSLERKEIDRKIHSIESKTSEEIKDVKHENSDIKNKISSLRQEQQQIQVSKDGLSRKLGRVEAMLEINNSEKSNSSEVSIPLEQLDGLVKEISSTVETGLLSKETPELVISLDKVKSIIESFVSRYKSNTVSINTKVNIDDLKETKNSILAEVQVFDDKYNEIITKISKLEEEDKVQSQQYIEDQKKHFEMKGELQGLTKEEEMLALKMNALSRREESFENEIKEGVVLVGSQVLEYANKINGEVIDEEEHDEVHRKIERLKIKLEDSGALGGDDVLREFKEVTERDEFLLKELGDLKQSLEVLKEMIEDLKDHLDRDFREGVKKINDQFKEFFTLMFGGGNAFLSLVAKKPRRKLKDEDGDEIEQEEEEEDKNYEHGIEINVSLPRKKVTDLSMLSGGERSLTSIALLFAISQVNPPPFLVLDETDAALDEANSRRYGDMLVRLSEYSQLIVVTHNRETMSRAQALYGVTIGSDGASKLLSVKFEEAENYAK